MKGNHRVAFAVMATMTLVACSADPLGPASHRGRPSLYTTGATEITAQNFGLPLTDPCVPAEVEDDEIISGSSTYIVAYGEFSEGCATPPADTSSGVTVPPSDTTAFWPSFH